ncbi:Pimeloyl-ACP methyl ester carboxylesterase [Thermanaeromonas toyohensis ToBE]|uniref:Pimeloyl-ACP methyl ester carboxylesterase n=1 Tax=Thermanaeromonas toyohensis ToBE TaxID=698762 RepID=A0A1W1W0S6_9FIRM|nr:alpha/beta hydrolase [Thermanaeromonas toyohensis]SMB99198.1 Pimeloyl-ACP methyl ester carboxylesterase [Thermanaeromonas toyohensis ToBE]
MPWQEVNGIRIYYEVYGAGEPLLLIEGLGYALWMWEKQIEAFSREFQVIAFDNRGVGKSDKPDEPYTIELMAYDAGELLNRLGITKAHILGVSMGGIIAQALALLYPKLVHTLVLVCTTFGGPHAVPVPKETVEAMLNKRKLPAREALKEAMRYAFGQEFLSRNPGELDRLVEQRLSDPLPRYAWMRQWEAILKVDLGEKVRNIKAPTLILTGDDDRVIPAQNSKLLHERIEGSLLEIFPGGGHLFFMEQAAPFNNRVLTFLKGHPMG